ncbi:MAG: hypothetical protein Kow0077_01830 [Anaerolineae bacterium]
MRRNRARIWGGALLALVALVVAVAMAGAVAAQQPVFVRLGLLVAADSPAGRGAQLAIAEINGAGGISGPDGTLYAFELLSVPVSTTDEIRAAIDALVERDVDVLFGPDDSVDVLETFGELQALQRPVLTAATGDSLTIADTADYLFRIRAPEQVHMQAAAAYLLSLNAQPDIVLVQNGSSAVISESVQTFTTAISNRGVLPRSTLQLNDPANLESLLTNLQGLGPNMIAVWGAPDVAAELLIRLREAGWNGIYFYRNASDPVFRAGMATMPPERQGFVVGVESWLPGLRTELSDSFLYRYVTTFGDVPDALSAAYYDAVYLVAAGIRTSGGDPAALRQGIQTAEPVDGVQGTLKPAQFFVGETLNSAVLFQLNSYGVPQVEARFADGVLSENARLAGGVVLATPAPAQPVGPPTPIPTATPEGVYGIVKSARLNVRTGPGLNFDVLGQLEADDVIFPIGANADFSWLVIPFRGMNGWVATYLVDLRGDRNTLPFIQPPPTPTPGITPTPSPVPFADLAVISVTLEPARPVSSQQFAVRAFVRNLGIINSGETALAATFQPGDVYTSGVIPPIAPGQTAEVVLRPTVNGTGTFTVDLVTDLNNLVNEGPAGEANNLYPVTYTLDKPVLRSGTAALSPGQQHDMMGSGTNILSWDGAALSAINGAQIAVLPGVNWETLNYNQLGSISGASVPRASLPVGVVVGLVTAPEGYRGALRIDGFSGDTVQYTYRIYAP